MAARAAAGRSMIYLWEEPRWERSRVTVGGGNPAQCLSGEMARVVEICSHWGVASDRVVMGCKTVRKGQLAMTCWAG